MDRINKIRADIQIIQKRLQLEQDPVKKSEYQKKLQILNIKIQIEQLKKRIESIK